MARSQAAGGPTREIDLQGSYNQLDEMLSADGALSLGGAFAQFPGAILIAGHNGIVLRANELAEPIGQVLQGGHNEDLRAAIQAALGGAVAQISPLVVATGNPKAPRERAFDVVVLPWGDGTAALLLGRDVTLERSLRAALIESRQRYKDLVEISNDFAWETDAEGRFVFVSPRGALGYAAADLVGQLARDLLLDGEGVETSPFTSKTVIEDAEMWVRSAAGPQLCLLSTARPLTSENGVWIGARGVCRDITTLRCHEADLAEARHRERLFSYIVNMVRRELDPARMLGATAEALVPALALSGVSIHSFIDDTLGGPLAQSGKPTEARRLADLAAKLSEHRQVVEIDEASGQLLLRATQYRDATNGLLCARRDSGEPWTVEDCRLLDNIAGQVGLAIEQLARQTEMEVLSMTDPLTGLNNRRGFVEGLEERFAGEAAGAGPGALFYIDLDNFKQVNDTHGHQTGDEALLDVAALLKEQIRDADLAARLGGDEFALFLGGIDRKGAERKGELLLQAAERLRGYSGDNDHPLGMSIGIAVYDPRTGESLDTLFSRGDEAMYAAKRNGKHSLAIAETHDRRGGQG